MSPKPFSALAAMLMSIVSHATSAHADTPAPKPQFKASRAAKAPVIDADLNSILSLVAGHNPVMDRLLVHRNAFVN